MGLPAEDFSGHSLRASGATDLFVARTPYYIKMGIWVSDSAMFYYQHEKDVMKAGAKAFRRIAISNVNKGVEFNGSIGFSFLQQGRGVRSISSS